MSQKISDRTELLSPVGTEVVPAVTALGNEVKIPVSALGGAPLPYILELVTTGNFINTSVEGDWNGVENADSATNICTWDAYTNAVTFNEPGIYDIKLITRLECYSPSNGSGSPLVNWPNMNLTVGAGLRNVRTLGWSTGLGDTRQSAHSLTPGLTGLLTPKFFQFTDSFLVSSLEFDPAGAANWTSPYVQLYCPNNDSRPEALRIKMLMVINRIKIGSLAPPVPAPLS